MIPFFILFVALFVVILLGGHKLLASSRPDPAKLSAYECGFSSVSDARHKFQLTFFLVAILFIVFASEIVFLYPLVVSLYSLSFFGYWAGMIFILILGISFVYELASGALAYSESPYSTNYLVVSFLPEIPFILPRHQPGDSIPHNYPRCNTRRD